MKPWAALLTLSMANAQEFAQFVKPVLELNCASCHKPSSRINFLSAETEKDIESKRGQWSSVAVRLRNRTMPPVASKLTEDERCGSPRGSTRDCARRRATSANTRARLRRGG